MPPHLQNNIQWIDEYGACLDAGIAGGAGVEFFRGNAVEQAFAVVILRFGAFSGADGGAYFFGAVAYIHHYFAGRQQFSGDIGRAGGCAAATFGASIGVHDVFPGQRKDVVCAKFGQFVARSGIGLFEPHHNPHFFLDFRHVFHFAFGAQFRVPGIGKCQQDVQVFGIRQINQETENSKDMQPPAETFYTYQCSIVEAAKKRWPQSGTYGKCSGSVVVFQTPGLQYFIATVHAKNTDDQDDFQQ